MDLLTFNLSCSRGTSLIGVNRAIVNQVALFDIKSRKFSVVKEYFIDANFQDKKYISNAGRFGMMELVNVIVTGYFNTGRHEG
ncbi:hypothetical protein M8C21_001284, partial [Ambrosia artemisiifolia]